MFLPACYSSRSGICSRFVRELFPWLHAFDQIHSHALEKGTFLREWSYSIHRRITKAIIKSTALWPFHSYIKLPEQILSESHNPHEIGGHQTVLKPSIVTMDTNVEVKSYQYQPRVAYVLRHSVADPEQETNYPSQENRCHWCIVSWKHVKSNGCVWGCISQNWHLMGKMMINHWMESGSVSPNKAKSIVFLLSTCCIQRTNPPNGHMFHQVMECHINPQKCCEINSTLKSWFLHPSVVLVLVPPRGYLH